MTTILADIPGVIYNIDNILVSGKNQHEPDSRLRLVLKKLKVAGVILKEKYIFSVSSIKFIGHITEDGIEFDPEKVKAVIDLP